MEEKPLRHSLNGIYILILFFMIFDEPYASKGACMVPKG
jgi:hypothetical protein